MRCRQPPPSSSSDDSDGSDIESCFDTEDEHEESDADTEPTDISYDVDGYDEVDLAGSLERTTPIRQSTTSIKKITPTDPWMKGRTIMISPSSSLI
jgi:hypothetical protein